MSEQVPVFVDPSGRRAKGTRWAGRLAAVVCFGYLLMVAIALVASPGVLRLAVPGFGRLLPNAVAPPIEVAGGSTGRPSALLTGAPVPSPTPFASASPTATAAVVTTPVATNPAGKPVPTPRRGSPTPATTTTATAVPTPTASPTAHRTGRPTAPPGAGKPTPTHGPRTLPSR